MTLLRQLNRTTKALLIAGLILIIYGYLCRIGIYFFWESKSIGWPVFMIGVILVLLQNIKAKKQTAKKAIIEKVAIGLISFILFIQSILMIAVSNSNALFAVKKYLGGDNPFESEIGKISGFGLIPVGSLHISTNSTGESGEAAIVLILKGEKKYKDVTIYLEKIPGRIEWDIVQIE